MHTLCAAVGCLIIGSIAVLAIAIYAGATTPDHQPIGKNGLH